MISFRAIGLGIFLSILYFILVMVFALLFGTAQGVVGIEVSDWNLMLMLIAFSCFSWIVIGFRVGKTAGYLEVFHAVLVAVLVQMIFAVVEPFFFGDSSLGLFSILWPLAPSVLLHAVGGYFAHFDSGRQMV